MKSILFFLVSIVAVTSALPGILFISNRDGKLLNLSVSLLEGAAFKSFLVPGIVSTATAGVVNLIAVFYYTERHPKRYNYGMV